MKLPEKLSAALASAKSLWGQALDLEPFDIAAVLTLGLLLIHAGSAWYLTVPMTVLCIAGLALRSLLVNSTYWLIISAIAAYANFRNWYVVDNHKFLLTYWCVAIHCSLLAKERTSALSLQGRWLIALCFLFADFWKLVSPDFLNGTFFKYQLLVDGRFSSIARFVGGVPAKIQHLNMLRLADLRAWDASTTSVPIVGGPRLAMTAQFMTWWTITIEVLIAVCWLSPSRFFLARWRHALLVAFVLTTYAVANVVGFGWLLLVMGLAHCPAEARRTRGLYYACFVFLHLFLIPFRNFGWKP